MIINSSAVTSRHLLYDPCFLSAISHYKQTINNDVFLFLLGSCTVVQQCSGSIQPYQGQKCLQGVGMHIIDMPSRPKFALQCRLCITTSKRGIEPFTGSFSTAVLCICCGTVCKPLDRPECDSPDLTWHQDTCLYGRHFVLVQGILAWGEWMYSDLEDRLDLWNKIGCLKFL